MVHTAPPYLKEHLNKVAKATLVDLKSKIVCNKLQALKKSFRQFYSCKTITFLLSQEHFCKFCVRFQLQVLNFQWTSL